MQRGARVEGSREELDWADATTCAWQRPASVEPSVHLSYTSRARSMEAYTVLLFAFIFSLLLAISWSASLIARITDPPPGKVPPRPPFKDAPSTRNTA